MWIGTFPREWSPRGRIDSSRLAATGLWMRMVKWIWRTGRIMNIDYMTSVFPETQYLWVLATYTKSQNKRRRLSPQCVCEVPRGKHLVFLMGTKKKHFEQRNTYLFSVTTAIYMKSIFFSRYFPTLSHQLCCAVI